MSPQEVHVPCEQPMQRERYDYMYVVVSPLFLLLLSFFLLFFIIFFPFLSPSSIHPLESSANDISILSYNTVAVVLASANIVIIEQLGREDIVEEVFASGVYNGNIREDS